MNQVLVTGATGNIGKALISVLREQNISFKAAVRNIQAASKKLHLDEEYLVEFDYEKPSTFSDAVEEVDQVFLLAPPLQPDAAGLLTPFIDFLKVDTSIRRVIYSGGMGIGKNPYMSFHTTISDMLKEKGFEYTILLPSFFSQNFKNFEYDNITQRGITFNVAGDGKVAFIDVNDIAAVAAKVLVEKGHTFQSYELTGPELLSHFEAAAILSEVLGKKVIYPNPSEKEYTQALKAANVPDFVAPAMIGIYSIIKENKVNYTTDTVEQITGKEPTAFKTVIQNDFLPKNQ